MESGLLGWIRRYVREHGNVPPDARIYVDGVELKSTGDDLLDALGLRDADVRLTIQMPPRAEAIVIDLVVDEPGVETWLEPPADDAR